MNLSVLHVFKETLPLMVSSAADVEDGDLLPLTIPGNVSDAERYTFDSNERSRLASTNTIYGSCFCV